MVLSERNSSFTRSSLRKLILLILIPILFISTLDEAQARKRKRSASHRSHPVRVYNPGATRAKAISIIRSTSENISELAGLEPMVAGGETAFDENAGVSEIGELGEDLEELDRESDVTIDIENFRMIWLSYVDDDNTQTIGGLKKSAIMAEIMDWLGTPYLFGGMGRRGIDCSAFVQKVFARSSGILLPRVAREQYFVGQRIQRNNLEFGDMVFFHTYSMSFASHVGIYLGDNLFAHAGSRGGVTVASLDDAFYAKRFIGGARLNERDVQRLTINPVDDNEEVDN